MKMSGLELHLISTSAVVGEPADCDIVFHLEGRQDDLPNISEIHPWAGRPISPLRDRLMIDCLFSMIGAQRRLRSMITQISALIKRQVKKRSDRGPGVVGNSPPIVQRVRIGVCCDNGAQMSPCFVEKLHEHYAYECKSTWEGLQVKRYHWDAFKGSWGRNRNFVWQHRALPFRFKKGDIGGISRDNLWINFPATIGAALEEEFQRNPYSSSFKCRDETFNFETGVMYDRNSEKMFRFRCTEAVSNSQSSGPKVRCWFLSSHSYLETARTYRSAGVLPYSVQPRTGEAVFLIGKITYGLRDWCDFGGLRNRFEKPRHTAARECYEETFGILGSSASLSSALKDFIANNAFKVVNEDTKYVSHFLRVPYGEYPVRFSEIVRKKKAEGKTVEVKRMSWVPVSSLKKAVEMAMLDQLRVTVESVCEDGKHEQKNLELLYLRNEFLHTLCIADKLGILSSIEHIAKEVHSRDSCAFKMPYVSMPKKFPKVGVTETAVFNRPDPLAPAPQDIATPVVINRTTDSESLADVETSVQTATLLDAAADTSSSEETITPDSSSSEETTTCKVDHLAPQFKSTPVINDLALKSENVSDLKTRVQATIPSNTALNTNTYNPTAVQKMPAIVDLTLDSEDVAVGVMESSTCTKTTVLLDTDSDTSRLKGLPASTCRDEVEDDTGISQVGRCTASTGDSSYSVPTKQSSQLDEEDKPRRRVRHAQKNERRDTDRSKRKAGTKDSNSGARKSVSDGPKTKKTILYYGMGAGTFSYGCN